MMRLLATLWMVAHASFNILEPGEQVEEFTVPVVYCLAGVTCSGLWYTLKLNVPTCLDYKIADVRTVSGARVPFQVTEVGEPGMPGYTLDMTTDWRFSGRIFVHLVVSQRPACGYVA